jgi:hypothetical protein
MPQLDSVTFLSQFFWFCIIFSSLYLILVKFCLPVIARILKVRELINTNKQNTLNDSKIITINPESFAIAKHCFKKYPNLKFDTQFLSECNLKFTTTFKNNYQKSIIENLILVNYGRAKNQFFAHNTSATRNVKNASQLFYFKIFNKVKNTKRFVHKAKLISKK